VATRDPFLLSIHHIDVFLQHRRGAKVGHIRAGTGFADGQTDVLASGKRQRVDNRRRGEIPLDELNPEKLKSKKRRR